SGNNYAFIDSQNLNLSILDLGWKLDFARFRIFLKERYSVVKAYIFIGYVKDNEKLYNFLRSVGYELIFKPTLEYKDRTTKGNCDAELVLQAMIDYQNYNKAILVTGDGDFHCLAKYLVNNHKLGKLLIPNEFSYSALLKRIDTKDEKFLAFINRSREILEYKKRAQ
ncbi:MAG: NYN domain-containing protein, partial [Candidatus Vogelbacteria bacterium]|nr:NYN domain-containing protein [Candidatus Vogelbacteria bacterium]